MLFVKVVCCYTGNSLLLAIPNLSSNINSTIKVETINLSIITFRKMNYTIDKIKIIMSFGSFLLLKDVKIICVFSKKSYID